MACARSSARPSPQGPMRSSCRSTRSGCTGTRCRAAMSRCSARRYRCLLSPIDPALSERRRAELQALVDVAVGQRRAGVRLHPAASVGVAGEPGARRPARPPPSRRSRRTTRRGPTCGSSPASSPATSRRCARASSSSTWCIPTSAGAELLADWLAVDITRFWSSIDLGR